jgi:CRISPR/Cas system-associated exonuclease Cas4 (RecB family)
MTTIERTEELTTAQLLLEWDARRARSQQAELGMSELGGCQRRAKYRITGTTPTNRGSSVQAVLGTAVHAAVEQVFKEMQAAGLIPAEDLVEFEVRFAGVLGHLDRYESKTQRIKDTKTTSDRWLQHIKVYGASVEHLWQTALYAAAVMQTGRRVREIVIDYLARDTGEDFQVVVPFDTQHVRDALAWLDNVRKAPLEMLNRAYEPDSSFCKHCPFFDTCWDGGVPNRDPRSVLLVEDPDKEKWARQLFEARAAKKIAEALEAEARGALDALRPITDKGTSDPIDVGFEHLLRWTVTTPQRLDTEAVKREYARVGAKPPYKDSKPTVKLEFVSREDNEK